MSNPDEVGYEIPVVPYRDPDAAVQELLSEWPDERPSQIAEQYVTGGNDVLLSFVKRHHDTMDPSLARKLREYVKSLDASGRLYEDQKQYGTPPSAQLMRRLLLNQVVPVIREVLGVGVLRRQARGPPEPVPGRASEKRTVQIADSRQQAKARIDASVRELPAYNLMRQLESDQFAAAGGAGGLDPEQELHMHNAI